MKDVGSEMEEGEICQDVNSKDDMTIIGESIQEDESSPAETKSEKTKLTKEVQGSSGKMQQEVENPGMPAESTPWKAKAIIGNGKIRDNNVEPTKLLHETTYPTHMTLINELPQGCFGPFQSFNDGGLPINSAQTNTIFGSLGKKSDAII